MNHPRSAFGDARLVRRPRRDARCPSGGRAGTDMAFGRLERTSGPQPMSDINMTPLIDVMLVLLVIFMITAPLMASSLKLDLPNTDAAQPSECAGLRLDRADNVGRALPRRREDRARGARRALERRGAQQPGDRGAAARRRGGGLRPRRRADRPGAEGRAEPHRLRRRPEVLSAIVAQPSPRVVSVSVDCAGAGCLLQCSAPWTTNTTRPRSRRRRRRTGTRATPIA